MSPGITPIADQVAVVQNAVIDRLPGPVQAMFAVETARLDTEGLPSGIVAPGSTLPDGALLDVLGRPTTLREARAGEPAVVVLYRGEWCPYCNLTLQVYQERLVPELLERGVALIALSPQKPDESLSMQEKHALTFTVLSDPGNQIARGLGVLHTPSAEIQAGQAALGLDVAAGNADRSPALPIPTVVIVDADGIVQWIDVNPKSTKPTEPEAILTALATTTEHPIGA